MIKTAAKALFSPFFSHVAFSFNSHVRPASKQRRHIETTNNEKRDNIGVLRGVCARLHFFKRVFFFFCCWEEEEEKSAQVLFSFGISLVRCFPPSFATLFRSAARACPKNKQRRLEGASRIIVVVVVARVQLARGEKEMPFFLHPLSLSLSNPTLSTRASSSAPPSRWQPLSRLSRPESRRRSRLPSGRCQPTAATRHRRSSRGPCRRTRRGCAAGGRDSRPVVVAEVVFVVERRGKRRRRKRVSAFLLEFSLPLSVALFSFSLDPENN